MTVRSFALRANRLFTFWGWRGGPPCRYFIVAPDGASRLIETAKIMHARKLQTADFYTAFYSAVLINIIAVVFQIILKKTVN